MGIAAESFSLVKDNSPRRNRIKSTHPHAPRGRARGLMETCDPRYRGYRCREGPSIALLKARLGGPLLPGFYHPCSRAGNTPQILSDDAPPAFRDLILWLRARMIDLNIFT